MAKALLFVNQETTPKFEYDNGVTVFETSPGRCGENTLAVLKEPEENAKLREKSKEIDAISTTLRNYMREYLLPTMYEEGGIGIASIQVGIPIQAFIVDIPIIKSINGLPCAKPDPRYVRNAVQDGRKITVREHRPLYRDGAVTMYVVEKILGGSVTVDDDCVAEEVIVERNPVFFLNPKIEDESMERVVIEEGCLSVPFALVQGEFGGNMKVERPLGVTVSYTDLDGQRCEVRADGAVDDHQKLLARCLQHEYDHLHGILYVDKLYVTEQNIYT